MKIRPEVLWFAEQMEKKLQMYDDARNWSDTTTNYLLRRLHEEYLVLKKALVQTEGVINEHGYTKAVFTIKHRFAKEHVMEECVDLANFCMMIADRMKK